MSVAVLSARELYVRRGARAGAFELRVDALDLMAGSVLAVLGPNGAGKSTLLRTLAGLEAPAGGSIERHTDGRVTLVFQRPIPFAGRVDHNVDVALASLRLSRADRRARCAEALAHFDIGHLASRSSATLSGGELRRLALARAFALRPAVWLLDEPFHDLDSSGREALSLDLRRAIADTDAAVAVVTHDLRRALLLSDRIAVLLNGRVAQQGSREELLARPTSVAVARQVGMANLVEGDYEPPLASAEFAHVVVDSQHRIPVVPGRHAARVLAGIRPERLKVDVGRGEGVPIGKGVVRTLVSDGVAATVAVDWAGRELRTHLLAGRGLARTLAPGDTVTLSVRPEDVHVLPLE